MAYVSCGSNRISSMGAVSLQVVAVIFLALMGLLQLSLLLTRNPSFWWIFSQKTAPRPSIFLLLPIAAFCTAATFVAVYWSRDLQPDGGRGVIDGATWAPVGLTWAYIFIWWNFTDLVKWAVWKVCRSISLLAPRCMIGAPFPFFSGTAPCSG